MKKLILTTIVALLYVMVHAVPFLIGAYAQYDLPNSGNHSDLKAKLLEAGYNASTLSISSNSNISSLGQVLNVFGSDIKTILSDQVWRPSAQKIGARGLTYGNYLKMEAEYDYILDGNVFTPDPFPPSSSDVFNYVFQHDVGTRCSSTSYSNGHAWVCDISTHSDGLALHNPRFRWKLVSTHTYPRSIGKDLKFLPQGIEGNRLYLTVAMRFSNLIPGYPVAEIKLKALNNVENRTMLDDYINNPDRNQSNNYHQFTLNSVHSSLYGPMIYNNAYNGVPRDDPNDPNAGSFLFEYFIEFPDPDTPLYNSLIVRADDGHYFLHINPEIDWQGHGRMEVDYIILEDEYHRNVRLYGTNSNELTWLNNRLNQIAATAGTNFNNIIYFKSKDEPAQGQFSIFNKVDNYLKDRNEDGAKLITATNLNDYSAIKLDGNNYEHYRNFLEQANPRTIAVDAYPLGEWSSQTHKLIQWNNPHAAQFVQKKIDEMLIDSYRSLAHAVRHSNDPSVRETELVYIPQIFGEYVTEDLDDPDSDIEKWRYFKPPKSMVKCLQFLPLCYSADGILDFTLLSKNGLYGNETEKYYRVAPLTHEPDYTDLQVHDGNTAFAYLTEANQKIAVYGPRIRELEWMNADCLMTYGGSDGVQVGPFLLTSLKVRDPNSTPPGGVPPPPSWLYNGYVQCGYYYDGQLNPSFMLVNRRAVTRTTSEGTIVQLPVDSNFNDASSQTVNFTPSAAATNRYGTYVSLYDPYDNGIYTSDSGVISVVMGPGDGKLLQMCSSLPPTVTTNADLKTLSYLAGNIYIDQGAVVTIHSGADCTILSNSSILVRGGSTLIVRGDMTIGDNVSIKAENGSNIIFENADCEWGIGSVLRVENSDFNSYGTEMRSKSVNTTWQGLRIINANPVTMTSTKISGGSRNQFNNTKVDVNGCTFEAPYTGKGMYILNTGANQDVTVSGTVFKTWGSNNMGNVGLHYLMPNSRLKVMYSIFSELNTGLMNSGSSAVTDSIIRCEFLYNTTGASFSANCSPFVNECVFNCDTGIRTENISLGSISKNTFNSEQYGIVSRNSSQRVANNKFYGDVGILNHSGSRLNMGSSAKNLFNCETSNLKFYDSVVYYAGVILRSGHNDFYQNNSGSFDFDFDSNFSVSPPPRTSALNANWNWFQDFNLDVNCPGVPSYYVYCNYMDSRPNVFLEIPPKTASNPGDGSDEIHPPTNEMVNQVSDEELDDENLLLYALDSYYRTAMATEGANSSIETYLLEKYAQYEHNNPPLSLFIENYLIHNYICMEDYQSAIDRLEQRILNSTCDLSSLHAVMDLESVLQIAALSDGKKPVNTKFEQYQYPNIEVYHAKHEEHWKQLNELLNKQKEEDQIPIPANAMISSNYPNPFNPSTTIAFSIPKDGLVKIDVYNIKGQKVKELCNTEMQRGHHKIVWNGKDKHHRSVSSGVYFVRLQANGQTSTRKVMLMK